jgi:glucokinase
MGSEFGHMKVSQSGGETVSVENIASGTALITRSQSLGFAGASVEELLLEKNQKYEPLFDDMARALALLCFNLSLGFHLEKIFFSGGLIKIQKHFLPQTKKYYGELIREFGAFACPLEAAKTKNLAGVIGAGYLPFMK